MIKSLSLTCAAWVLAAACALGDIIVQYNAGTGDATTRTNAPSMVIDGAEASILDVSSPQQPISYNGGMSVGAPPSPENFFFDTDWNVVDDSRYYELSVTVSNGYQMTVTDLDVWQRSFASRTTNYFVRTSLDGFTANVVESTVPGGFSWNNTVVPMGAPTYSEITGTLTIRIYGQGAPASASQWQIDHVTLNGTVGLIPEPSTTALLVLGLGSLFFLRRKKPLRH